MSYGHRSTQKHNYAGRDVILNQNSNLYADRVVLGNASRTSTLRGAYLEQVRALAPESLKDRDDELERLTTFCTSESTVGEYLWWRAEAWSGKSALLSWFVLHPPTQSCLVSFFVTSALPDQNSRRSFVENVLDQLYDLLGELRPVGLTDENREAHLRKLLPQVAEQVRERGEHFTLVVDGLDEDRGVDGSTNAYSIASLLPKFGVRVVVASRPQPDLSDDVWLDHPLYESAIVEQLSPSRHAAAVRNTMIRDLKGLRVGTPVQQDLLGFITTAGGGLSARDLAELSEISEWEVEDDLRTVAGRSFTRRPGEPPVYVLAHVELECLATEILGPRLDVYRQRLHEWADRYQARGWPTDTPRFLLHGYTATLTQARDLPRLLEHVTDPRRQELITASSDRDDAALAEIVAAQNRVLSHDKPDLVSLARLAVHRTSLYMRNDWIPTYLPSCWAMVGDLQRATSLLASIGNPGKRSHAMRMTAEEFHEAEEFHRAAELLDEVEALAMSFNQWWGAWPLVDLAETAVRTDDHERARRAVEAIRNIGDSAGCCATLTLAALAHEQHDAAEEWYRKAEATFNESNGPVHLTTVARMAAAAERTGRPSKAVELVNCILMNSAERIFSFTTDDDQARAAKTLARAGLTEAACAVSARISEREDQENSLLDVTRALAYHNLDESEELARTAFEPKYMYARLAAVAFVACRAGDKARADRLIAEIDTIVNGLPHDEWRRFTITGTAVTCAEKGDMEHAETLLHNEMVPANDSGGVISVATSLARQGAQDRASQLVSLGEKLARTSSAGVDEMRLASWVSIMIDFGEFERAEQLVRVFSSDAVRTAGWAILAEGLIAAGSVDRVEQVLPAITDPDLQRRPRLDLLLTLATRGEIDRSISIARSAAPPLHRCEALILISENTHRPELLDEILSIASEVTVPEEHVTILATALRTAAKLGDRPRSTVLLEQMRRINDDNEQQPIEGRAFLGILRSLPERIRTLTELVDIVDARLKFSKHKDPCSNSWNAGPSIWSPERDLPKNVELGRKLVRNDWFDIVKDLVKVDPAIFPAIVSELDRLGGPAALHPLPTRFHS